MISLKELFRPSSWKVKAIGYSNDKKKQSQRIKELITSRDSLKTKYINLQNRFEELEKRHKEVSDALKKN
jgi:molecular chaperone GrpE (heat shock protein)